jgi:hypothetical protein
VGSFSILPIGTYAALTNFHQPRDTTAKLNQLVSDGVRRCGGLIGTIHGTYRLLQSFGRAPPVRVALCFQSSSAATEGLLMG